MVHHYTCLHSRIPSFASIPGKLLKYLRDLSKMLPQSSKSSDSTRKHFSGKTYAALLLFIYMCVCVYKKPQRLPEHKYNK